MRIYNGTNSVVDLPYVGDQRISILPHSISGNIGCTNSLLSLIVTAYTQDELCIVVSGPFELNMCAGIPTVVNYTVQSLEEAVARFMPKEEKKPVEEKAMRDVCEKEIIEGELSGCLEDACEEKCCEKESCVCESESMPDCEAACECPGESSFKSSAIISEAPGIRRGKK